MDPIDILGGLLGQKSGGGGLGTKILKDLLGGAARGTQPQPTPPARPTAGQGGGRSEVPRGSAIAQDLEDLLNVARDRRGSASTPPAPRASQAAPHARPQSQTHPHNLPSWGPPLEQGRYPRVPQDQNEQAILLIRAMVNAAKADGQVTQEEQENLINQVGGASPQAIQFLRDEFAKPLDVREFVWSVPIGMEEQVYTMSLSAIDLDTHPEADYLRELAHGLRIPPEACNQIHQRLGAPPLFDS